jgi:hypothetical protein
MDNGNKPAFSVALRDNGNANHPEAKGLTKREYFAGLAMQGICANSNWNMTNQAPIITAVEIADALLKELEKQQ